MEIIDISMPIHAQMHAWPGDPPVEIVRAQSIDDGDSCNLTRLSISAHTGTHVDAPLHFIQGGGSVDGFAPKHLIGRCRVILTRGQPEITRADIEGARIRPGERILLKTSNSERLAGSSFLEDYIGISKAAAKLLAEIGPIVIGTDYLSVGPYSADNETVHQHLLGAGIILIEGLDLSRVEPGAYELICAPLLLIGCEGAPARVFLRHR